MDDDIEGAVDLLADGLESDAERLGISPAELADRLKVEIAARGELLDTNEGG